MTRQTSHPAGRHARKRGRPGRFRSGPALTVFSIYKKLLLTPGPYIGIALGIAGGAWLRFWFDELGPTSLTVAKVALASVVPLALFMRLPTEAAVRWLSPRGRHEPTLATDALLPADAATASWLTNALVGIAIAIVAGWCPWWAAIANWLTDRFFLTPLAIHVSDTVVIAAAWLPAAASFGLALSAGMAAANRPGGGGFEAYLARLSITASLAVLACCLLDLYEHPLRIMLAAAALPTTTAILGSTTLKPVAPPKKLPPLPKSAPARSRVLTAGLALWAVSVGGFLEAARRATQVALGADPLTGPLYFWASAGLGLGAGLLSLRKTRFARFADPHDAGIAMLAAAAAPAGLVLYLAAISAPAHRSLPVWLTYPVVGCATAVIGMALGIAYQVFAAQKAPSTSTAIEFAGRLLTAGTFGTVLWAGWLMLGRPIMVSAWIAILAQMAVAATIASLEAERHNLSRTAATCAALLALYATIGPWTARNWNILPGSIRISAATGSYWSVAYYRSESGRIQVRVGRRQPIDQGMIDALSRAAAAALSDEIRNRPVLLWRLLPADATPHETALNCGNASYLLDAAAVPARAVSQPDAVNSHDSWWARLRCLATPQTAVILQLPQLDARDLRALLPRTVISHLTSLLGSTGKIYIAAPPTNEAVLTSALLRSRLRNFSVHLQRFDTGNPAPAALVLISAKPAAGSGPHR